MEISVFVLIMLIVLKLGRQLMERLDFDVDVMKDSPAMGFWLEMAAGNGKVSSLFPLLLHQLFFLKYKYSM
jgi:hypothetical protein